jgi:Ala-tRNA(Pro) deacylase
MAITQFFASHQFDFPRFEHHPAQTCSEFQEIASHIPGTRNKNLFLRDKKGLRHLLVIVPSDLSVDLDCLSKILGIKHLGFASKERLKKFLGVSSGSVSVLSLMNDTLNKVELVIDRSIWQADAIQAHPLINTQTVIISKSELERFLLKTRHQPTILEVPGIPSALGAPGTLLKKG